MYQELETKLSRQIKASLKDFEYQPSKATLQNVHSRYRVTSAMQKAIRRGHIDIALKMAGALNNYMPNYFWSRIATIAMEDVMLGNREAVAETMFLSSNKDWRYVHDEKRLAAYIVHRLASGGKDRTSCDAIVGCAGALSLQHIRDELASYSAEQLQEVMADPEAHFEDRIIAGRYLFGTSNATNYKDRKGSPNLVMPVYRQMHKDKILPLDMLYIIDIGFKRKAEQMPVAAGIVYAAYNVDKTRFEREAVDNYQMLGSIPSYAHDTHTAEGKKAVEYFGKICEPLAALTEKHSKNPPSATRCMFFRADTDLLNKRLKLKDKGSIRDRAGWGLGQYRHEMEPEHFWKGVQIIQDNYAQVEYARKKMLGDTVGKLPPPSF